MNTANKSTALAEFIWQTRYRATQNGQAEKDLFASRERVARAAAAEEHDRTLWSKQFSALLHSERFLPGGRILANAGTGHSLTLANCFVMPPIEDSIKGIFESLKQSALTLQQGGGIGIDFSRLRPRGSAARSSATVASGPAAFLPLWNSMSEAMCSAAEPRRGAMMGTLHCEHADLNRFIDAGCAERSLEHFDLSVLITDEFMAQARSATSQPERPAQLWRQLAQRALANGRPGVLFIDRINASNNLQYCERIVSTNPCGEAPLPDYGSCLLGSVNLTRLIRRPFSTDASFDADALVDTAQLAVRFLDNCLEMSPYPLAAQRAQARHTRRLGVGITGLADSLAMLGLRYESDEGRSFGARVAEMLRDACYSASIALATERGCCAAFRRDAYLETPFIRALPQVLRQRIARNGVRNSHLLAIAPAGSISLLAGNVSNGIEPIVALEIFHSLSRGDGTQQHFHVDDYAYSVWRSRSKAGEPLPRSLDDVWSVSPQNQLRMQAALQPYVDGAIAKTVLLAKNDSADDVRHVLEHAHELGLKGCSVYRAT